MRTGLQVEFSEEIIKSLENGMRRAGGRDVEISQAASRQKCGLDPVAHTRDSDNFFRARKVQGFAACCHPRMPVQVGYSQKIEIF